MHGMQYGVVCGLSGRLARVASLVRPDYVTDWLTIPQHISHLAIDDQVAFVENLTGPGVILALDAEPGGEKALRPMGQYDSGMYYAELSIVGYEGSSYLCMVPCIGVLPTDTYHWLLLAAKGKDGEPGAKPGLDEMVFVGPSEPTETARVWMQTID